MQCLLEITNLGLKLFSNDEKTGRTENWNSRNILVVDNTKIIDNYKKFNVLLTTDTIKINDTKPTLKTQI